MMRTATDKQSQKWALGIIPDAANRERDDYYPTPPEGVHGLLMKETFDGPIWEPACGDGAISRVLEKWGYKVESTDLVDRGYGTPRVDFLMEQRLLAPNIVTNPPFKYCEEFLHRALDLGAKKVALLCRLAWLEGKARKQMFATTPIARVWVFSSRLHMQRAKIGKQDGGAGGMIAFAWFVWDHSHKGPPTLGWI